MKSLILTAAMIFSSAAGASSVLDTNFTCDGGRQVTYRYDSLTVEGENHIYMNSSLASGKHENGGGYAATVHEFDGGWMLVLADDDVNAAVVAHEEDVWYCERNGLHR